MSTMAPNLVFFQVLKPSPIKDAAGNDQFGIIGMTQELPAALGLMQQHPGAVVTVVVCIAINPAHIIDTSPLTPTKN